MADFDGASVEYGLEQTPRFPSLVEPVIGLVAEMDGFRVRRIETLDALVVTKTVAGFDPATVAAVRELMLNARAGRLGRLKFLAFDFAHEGEASPGGADDFETMIAETANLILSAPIVTVACARATMAGADLEFALACSMMIGEQGARFSFAADPIVSIGTYGLLAQKIGFVRAERLMEQGEVLDVAQMRELYLLKDEPAHDAGVDRLEAFLQRTSRRYNSCYGIYRAQRITSPIRSGLGAVA